MGPHASQVTAQLAPLTNNVLRLSVQDRLANISEVRMFERKKE